MKSILFSFIMILLLTSCSEKSNSNLGNSSSDDSLPIDIQKIQEGNKVLLQVSAQSGFGIQIEVPNVISVTAEDGLTINSKDLTFSGSPNPKKPEYYLNLKPMELTVNGNGKLLLQGKIFYCDFSKNICLPGKLYRELSI